MKKNTIKAFTLTEMLIVIVIIGILIAALMPRMQAAQGRARDVSRKTALSQIQSAIVVSQGDKGEWPGISNVSSGCTDTATSGIDVKCIKDDLIAAGMNSIPVDPLASTEVEGLGGKGSKGEYRYMVTTRNGSTNGGFILMAKTEVEGGSNYVVCNTGNTITSSTDIADSSQFALCTSITKDTSSSGSCVDAKAGNGACKYNKDDQLRYVVVY